MDKTTNRFVYFNGINYKFTAHILRLQIIQVAGNEPNLKRNFQNRIDYVCTVYMLYYVIVYDGPFVDDANVYIHLVFCEINAFHCASFRHIANNITHTQLKTRELIGHHFVFNRNELVSSVIGLCQGMQIYMYIYGWSLMRTFYAPSKSHD